MDDLIEALNIFRKYGNKDNPLDYGDDKLRGAVDPADVSLRDTERLYELCFAPCEERRCFTSLRFGSW